MNEKKWLLKLFKKPLFSIYYLLEYYNKKIIQRFYMIKSKG
jgi:hypothetical protein